MLWVCAEVSVKFVTEISCFWCTDCRKAVKDILCLYIGTLNHHGRYQNLKVTYFQCSVVFSVRCCRSVRGFITMFVLFPYYLPSPYQKNGSHISEFSPCLGKFLRDTRRHVFVVRCSTQFLGLQQRMHKWVHSSHV